MIDPQRLLMLLILQLVSCTGAERFKDTIDSADAVSRQTETGTS